MKYGQIAGNKQINALIYRCFEHICEEDERSFVRKFREQPHDSAQIMHTFRELVLGAYLGSSGLKARYDWAIDTQTPDWCILGREMAVTGIVELVNFHIDKTTENEIEEQLQARGVTTAWRDHNKNNADRLYHCIWHKAQVYRALVEDLGIPYIVAVFGQFQAAIDFEDDLSPCLFDKESGLFEMYPDVSGVLYFEEISGLYLFNYTSNPYAVRSFGLLSGVFPPESG
jgi:hypothetical protein